MGRVGLGNPLGRELIDIQKILNKRGDFKVYVPEGQMKDAPWPSLETEEWVRTYNPDTELIAVFLTQGGGTQLRRLSGKPTPKEACEDLAEKLTGKRTLPHPAHE